MPLQDVSRTLVKTLLRQVARLPHQSQRKRLRAPVIVGFWGQGGKIPQRTVADRILAAFPSLHNVSGFENVVPEHITPNIYIQEEDDSQVNDFQILRRVLLSIIRQRIRPPDRETLDLWINQGFDAHRSLAEQHDLWLGSCITETNGLYIDVTSMYQPEMSAATNRPDAYMYAYSLYIENKSKHTLQILGRHWKMHAHDRAQNVEEVKQLQQGLVGKQPKLAPGESFYYVSGTQLDSNYGEMSGKFLVRKYPDDAEEMNAAREENFFADVGPFDLVAPER